MNLNERSGNELITRDRCILDLTDQLAVKGFFADTLINEVYLCAAVGGIFANNNMPANFIYENLMIECNLIHQAWLAGVSETFISRLQLHLP